MGKSRKLSKGISNGFIPEYRHTVETMAESEGLGSSGRVDNNEMSLSQDSCTRRQKCIRINGEGYNQFGVPVQVLSLSKILRSDRRELEFKLRRELDQVRFLQRKVASMNFDTMVKSSSSVSSIGKKRPPIQNILPSQHPSGKKQTFGGQNGSLIKRDISENVVPANGLYNKLMKQCEGLLNQLMRHKNGWVFNNPVDVVALNIPDYFNIIKTPMDFGTIKGKIAAGKYSTPLEFAADVRLTFSNAMIYNPAQNNVHIMAKGLSKYFESKWKPIEKKIPGDFQLMSSETDASNVKYSVIDQGPPLKKKKLPLGNGTLKSDPVNKKMQDLPNKKMHDALNKKISNVVSKKISDPVSKKMPDPVSTKMSDEEINALSMELDSVANDPDLPDSIKELLQANISGAGELADGTMEIDLFALNADTLLKLRMLLDDYLMEKKKKETKAEPCEMELHNDGGFTKSLMQRVKGNDIEEDIDIGGNDSPILSFPPIEIQKDAAHENLKASSSSSSSSSGSSSSDSDSDSGSSSGSDCEGTNPNHVNSLEANVNADETSNHNPINTKGPDIRTDTLDVKAEKNSTIVPSSVEGGGRSEGESAPFERQVSPEKVYRAALLKSRFADTILKAQEKTLDKGVKKDPEKLRIEREKLEKMQREEKARLHAAALAAEEARKKADAEAAAEAKRNREMEREAARLALQQMEKTVHIDESCKFLEDLEMLRVDPLGDLSSITKDEDLEHSENMLGSFKLQSSTNPLEQLGLYMKQDDDEDEDVAAVEAPPHNSPRIDNFKLQSSTNPLEQLGLYVKQDDDEEEEIAAGEAPPHSSPRTGNDVEDGEID